MKILTIQDMSCYGGSSLSVALPVLSRAGLETAVLPTAILSTNTSVKNAKIYDFTTEMEEILNHWINEGFVFDAIYTGYIANPKQIDIILKAKEKLLKKDGLVFVDPAIADNGALYKGLDEKIVEGMKKLCSVADYIFPNITEACLLTNQEYNDNVSIQLLLQDLYKLGAKNVILTSVSHEDKIGAVLFNAKKNIRILRTKEKKTYCGLGDLFTSSIVGSICNGTDDEIALNKACDLATQVIKKTSEDTNIRKNISFESLL